MLTNRLLVTKQTIIINNSQHAGTTRLQAIISKAKTAQRIQNVVLQLVDMRKAGFMTQPPLAAVFEGRAPGCNGKGIVELFIYKTDVGQYILYEWAAVNMPRAAQTVIQLMIKIFSSVKSYRSYCGYPGKNTPDCSWRAGWTSQMDELFGLVENILFDQIFDGPLKDAVKRGQTPEELMNGEVLHEATERIKNLYEADDDRSSDSEDENGRDWTMSHGDVDDTNNKDGKCKKTSIAIEESEEDSKESIARKNFDKAVIRLVDSFIMLIADKGGPDDVLAKSIAETPACKFSVVSEGLQGKALTLLIVDPGNIGESSAHPHLRKPPCNQDVVNRCVQIGLMARSLCEEGMASTEKIMPHDCWAMFEGGRAIESMLMKAFKGQDGKMIKKSKFVLTINIDEQSIIDNIGRSTQMGSVSCTDRCILTTSDDLNLPRRNRTHYKGATFFNIQVFNAP